MRFRIQIRNYFLIQYVKAKHSELQIERKKEAMTDLMEKEQKMHERQYERRER